jgi:hypothetical protein
MRMLNFFDLFSCIFRQGYQDYIWSGLVNYFWYTLRKYSNQVKAHSSFQSYNPNQILQIIQRLSVPQNNCVVRSDEKSIEIERASNFGARSPSRMILWGIDKSETASSLYLRTLFMRSGYILVEFIENFSLCYAHSK